MHAYFGIGGSSGPAPAYFIVWLMLLMGFEIPEDSCCDEEQGPVIVNGIKEIVDALGKVASGTDHISQSFNGVIGGLEDIAEYAGGIETGVDAIANDTEKVAGPIEWIGF